MMLALALVVGTAIHLASVAGGYGEVVGEVDAIV
jgi:hypothetical protein